MKSFNIIVTGVGGQGVLTTSSALGQAALAAGLDVKVAELHGLAVRFGTLEAHVKIGKRVLSPLIPEGKADLIIGLERLETLRGLGFANDRTAVLFDPRAARPPLSYIREEHYPTEKETIKAIRKVTKGKVLSVPATEKVKGAGLKPVMANIYILGAGTGKKFLPLSRKHMLEGVKWAVPARALEDNKRVFELGRKLK